MTRRLKWQNDASATQGAAPLGQTTVDKLLENCERDVNWRKEVKTSMNKHCLSRQRKTGYVRGQMAWGRLRGTIPGSTRSRNSLRAIRSLSKFRDSVDDLRLFVLISDSPILSFSFSSLGQKSPVR